MSINSCGINGLASGLRVDGFGSGGSLVAVVCAVAFFAVVVFGFAFAGFAFACAIGFDLCAVAFFATGFFVVVAFFATGFVFAMIILLVPLLRRFILSGL